MQISAISEVDDAALDHRFDQQSLSVNKEFDWFARIFLYSNVFLSQSSKMTFEMDRDRQDRKLAQREEPSDESLMNPWWISSPGSFRMHLQCIVLQLRGRQVGQGDPGQPAAVDPLRQAASTPGRRYTATPVPYRSKRYYSRSRPRSFRSWWSARLYILKAPRTSPAPLPPHSTTQPQLTAHPSS